MANRGTSPNWVRRHPLWTTIILVCLAGLAWLFYPKDSNDFEDPLIAPVVRGAIEDLVTASGELKPIRVVSVGAQVSGQLKALHVKVGDRVTQGDLIAEIDAEVQEKEVEASLAQLRGLETQLPASRANLEFAEANFRRQSRLMEENATAEAQFDQARATLAAAKAQILKLESNIEQSRMRIEAQKTLLRYSRIEAPISGTVSEVQVEVGQTLNAAQQTPVILNIADITSMQVRSYVSEADVRRLEEGMPVYFTTLGDQTRRWEANLSEVLLSPQNRGNVIFYPALFEVANEDESLLPDMTAEVFFVMQSAEDVLVVPLAALTIPSEPGTPSASAVFVRGARPDLADRRGQAPGTSEEEGTLAIAYVVDDSGDIARRNLRIGARDLVSAQVLTGLEAGEQVIIGSRVEHSNSNVRVGVRVR